jgi:hypothetical protein
MKKILQQDSGQDYIAPNLVFLPSIMLIFKCFTFGESNVSRSTELDLAGVDFEIILMDKVYNIHIFVDSPRAWEYRNYKSQYKQVNSRPGIHVNLPYSLQSGKFNSLRF